MTTSLYSSSWYRVAKLKPRLRLHVEIHRHTYRGELWYVLQDHSKNQLQRFNPEAYQIIGLMDGKLTVQEIWEEARFRLKEDAPTQEDMIRILGQLHAVDVLQCDVTPDTAEALKRFEKKRSGTWMQKIRNPLAIRFSIFDPEQFLNRCNLLARIVFSWPGAVLWLAVAGTGMFLAGVHWSELTENITDIVLAPSNLILMWFIFPVLKAFHEFGHAFAIKRLGGEVHDMGIMMLVFMPIPYVDASSSTAFRSKWERILVGGAGMALELFIASLALFIWIHIEPGTVRAFLYNIIFLAGVSSLLFNGNPLLRFDAYYMLSDFLEIPNLGQRGNKYLGYLTQRHLFGIRDAEPPQATPGERVWFIVYGITSFVYRILIYVSIIIFIAGKFFVAGIILAAWVVAGMIVWPAIKGIKFLFYSPKLGRKRARAVLVTGIALISFLAIVLFVPVPLCTRAEGVIWVPEQCFVRAGTDGFIDRIVVMPGVKVTKGESLIECSDPFLPARIRVLESKLNELKVLYDTQIISDRIQAEITVEEIKSVIGELEDARKKNSELMINSLADGTFFSQMSQDLPGRFVKRGELLGYVLDSTAINTRVVVSQSDIDMVRQRTFKATIRFPENLDVIVHAVVKRESPAATDQLPSRTLGQQGGGEIAIDPHDQLGTKAFQKMFLFDIELPEPVSLYNVGGRVYVRFDHGLEPLVWRWYRSARQLFLRQFSV